MRAYYELKRRRDACEKEAMRCQKDIFRCLDHVRNNYGDMIFQEVENHLFYPGSLGNKILRFFIGKKQVPSAKLMTPTGRPTLHLIEQLTDFGRPLLISTLLGFVKRSIVRRFRKRR
ncbi:hypothetical protein HR17_00755 [Porphyromonas gulae]|uniref:Uncharacterized protein n=1 Tax=Porphyromonas gulae TaxID=111105 RepID=A0A0A2FS77_9PORP|nr:MULTISPECIES: hypothetical protein [Porphyromonas]KGL56884.1 hypothetical protein HQ50_00835 [Porphyromonas sp. COT-052 OH4946]KGN71115.1 hypothetical protein HR09_02080 [Porphyromonas gulae]KGN72811.1 hypothetical protein HQ40_10210 [Porphyromonas gulae]KGN77207.1 hypothetical protein HR17_00755 [Porphyromonas gulae]KGN81379.1 hypothetical protein HR13_00495 [Porphyromonas gulae]